MTDLVRPEDIEHIVGVRRHQRAAAGRLISSSIPAAPKQRGDGIGAAVRRLETGS